MTDSTYQQKIPVPRQVLFDGLWKNNPGLIQLLGLCPLLAISNTFINALGLGIATLLTLILSNTAVSCLRHRVPPEIRIPLFVLLIASIVTMIELIMNAWLHQLYLVLGIFIPLIVTNCMILGRAETFAKRNGLVHSMLDGFAHGMGFLMVLVCLGGLRELLGFGTLFRDAHLLFGEVAINWTVHPFSNGPEIADKSGSGLLLALLPPGAFMLLGLLLVGRNMIDHRHALFSGSDRKDLNHQPLANKQHGSQLV